MRGRRLRHTLDRRQSAFWDSFWRFVERGNGVSAEKAQGILMAYLGAWAFPCAIEGWAVFDSARIAWASAVIFAVGLACEIAAVRLIRASPPRQPGADSSS